MKILVIGGTRFFGKNLIWTLLRAGHDVTIATRGHARDTFDDRVTRIIVDRTDAKGMCAAFQDKKFDVVYDMLAYASLDIRHSLYAITCRRYIFVSSASVYEDRHPGLRESEFDPLTPPVIWGERSEFSYSEGKRQAERAAFQAYADRDIVAVRFPVVLGEDDYTGRLRFYSDHVLTGEPMAIDNLAAQLGFISQNEAGEFLAFLGENSYCGAINGASSGTISLEQILRYVGEKTKISPRIDADGAASPYNGEGTHSLDIRLAEGLGFAFAGIREWIYPLLDTLMVMK